MRQDLIRTSEDLRRLLDNLLLTRQVSNHLETCDAAQDGLETLERMHHLDYEVLGVVRAGELIGTVQRDQLGRGDCGRQCQAVSHEMMVDADASLLELLRCLNRRRWMLVRSSQGSMGIVSRRDLQRPAVRMLLFGLVSLFEMQLRDMVNRCYTEAAIAVTLKPGRLSFTQRLLAERHKRGEELTLADCLQIADKRDLLLAARGFTVFFGFATKKAAHRFFTQVEALRDRLVHAQDLVAGSSWDAVTATALQLARFTEHYELHYREFTDRVRIAG
jgi:hypothetical protein